MKKINIYSILAIIIISLVICKSSHLVQNLNLYTHKLTEQQLGAEKLTHRQEEFIKSIALEMNIYEPINIRKMNHNALSLYGYHNAFAYFPLAFGFIPIKSNPFLFISKGFFEDLSKEEQRFLIGHEMIHIKEKHTTYLNLISYVLLLSFLMLLLFLNKHLKLIVKKYISIKYNSIIAIITSCLLFLTFIGIADVIESAYRRSIEKEADIKSIHMLKSYDGFLKLIDRYKKEIPEQNKYFELFSDHPSHSKRENYCLEEEKIHNSKQTQRYKETI